MNERKELVTVPKRTVETESTPHSTARSVRRRGHLQVKVAKRPSPRKHHNANRSNSPLSAAGKKEPFANPLLQSVALDLSTKVETGTKRINASLLDNAKALIAKKFQAKLTDQVLDINIRRMRAQVVKRDQYEKEKALAAQNKPESHRAQPDYDDERYTLTYDYKGNKMVVNAVKEDTLPSLQNNQMLAKEAPEVVQSSYGFGSRGSKRALQSRASVTFSAGYDGLINQLESKRVSLGLTNKSLMGGFSEIKDVADPKAARRADKRRSSQLQVHMDQGFKIKDNMKAAFGVSFQEREYKDTGPAYEEQFRTVDPGQVLSLRGYNDLKLRGKSTLIVQPLVGSQTFEPKQPRKEEEPHDDDLRVQSRSELSHASDHRPDTATIVGGYKFQSNVALYNNRRRRIKNISKIRIHTEKGQKAMLSKSLIGNKMANISTGYNDSPNQTLQHSQRGGFDELNLSQLPHIPQPLFAGPSRNDPVAGSMVLSQATASSKDRGIFTASTGRRLGSALMKTSEVSGRVVTASYELRNQVEFASLNCTTISEVDRQSQLEIAQASKANHRQLMSN